jgi:transposase
MNNEFYIRSSKHSFSFLNKEKTKNLQLFLQEYRRISQLYIDYFWSNKFKDKYSYFNLKTHNYKLPFMLSNIKINKDIQLKTTLSARALKCCLTQVLGIINGTLGKQRKRQYIANQKRKNHSKVSSKLRKLLRKEFKKPDASKINPELNSICFNYKEIDSKEFDGFIQLKSIISTTKNFVINIPIKFHRQSNKLKKKGTMMNSILFSDNYISIRWKIEKPQTKKRGKIVGADQGLKTIITLSDKQITPVQNKDGYNLQLITEKLSRKKKGSKSFKKAQDHRKNFINWLINQLNFNGIKTIKLEDVINIGYKNNSGRFMSHWTNTLIRDKIIKRCEEEKVSLLLDDSCYYSQRCSQCGLVLKSSRSGKTYFCKNCGLNIDADLNSALNHQQELSKLPDDLRRLKLNRKGFFWRPEGLYTLTGEELTVPLSKK